MGGPESAKRRLTPEDIYNIVLVSDAQISPDKKHVAYVRTILDKEKNDYRSSIYVAPAEGGDPRRFTAADAKDTFPRWSPDGSRLAFLSDRSGSNQIWVIPVGGGEATQLTDVPEPITYFAWSPDGSTIAFVSKLEREQLEKKDEDKGAKDEEKSDVVHITRIRYRADGTPGFLDDKRSHIWCVPSGGGTPWQVTSGDFNDSLPAWSPSGQEIAFVSNRTEDREYNTVSEIWAVPARGGEARRVLGGEDAAFSLPVWSPDGTQIAVAGNRDPRSGGATNDNIWVVASGGGEPRSLTAALDRSVGDAVTTDTFASSNPGVVWSPDGHWIYFQLSDSGNTHVYRT
ncbi:MAG TPA: hypothetical protein VF190_16165, partial [Rhodothermales bacterium]